MQKPPRNSPQIRRRSGRMAFAGNLLALSTFSEYRTGRANLLLRSHQEEGDINRVNSKCLCESSRSYRIRRALSRKQCGGDQAARSQSLYLPSRASAAAKQLGSLARSLLRSELAWNTGQSCSSGWVSTLAVEAAPRIARCHLRNSGYMLGNADDHQTLLWYQHVAGLCQAHAHHILPFPPSPQVRNRNSCKEVDGQYRSEQ